VVHEEGQHPRQEVDRNQVHPFEDGGASYGEEEEEGHEGDLVADQGQDTAAVAAAA
jgi:hypothetical protein